MGSRIIVGAALALGSSAVVGHAACRGVPAHNPAPSASVSTTVPDHAGPGSAAASPGSAAARAPDASASAMSPEEELATAIAAARDCKAPLAEITNEPQGGVIFNNALTSADAGSIDRGQGVLDALGEQSTAFRCCLDAWFRDHPDRQETVMLRLELAGDGAVTRASVIEARSTLGDELSLACVVSVAQDATFPPSPRDVPTVVNYPIRVAARARNQVDTGTKPDDGAKEQ